MFRKVRWLFFDVGSTLVDEQLAYRHRMQEIAAQSGTAIDSVWEMALHFYRQNKKGDLETAAMLGVELPKWHKEDERPYPEAAACLKELSSRYHIGIIANQSAGTTERLKKYGLLQYIDLVTASAEEGVAKPDRRLFEIALERSGARPDEAVMIGDRIDNDILPAKALGMHTIWIRQGFGQYWNITREVETPDCIARNLMEICSIL